MNTEQVESAARSVVAALLAFAAGKGWISTSDVVSLTPLLGSLALLAWGVYAKRDAAKVQAVKTVPGVEEIKVNVAAAPPAVAAMALSSKPENEKIVPLT